MFYGIWCIFDALFYFNNWIFTEINYNNRCFFLDIHLVQHSAHLLEKPRIVFVQGKEKTYFRMARCLTFFISRYRKADFARSPNSYLLCYKFYFFKHPVPWKVKGFEFEDLKWKCDPLQLNLNNIIILAQTTRVNLYP